MGKNCSQTVRVGKDWRDPGCAERVTHNPLNCSSSSPVIWPCLGKQEILNEWTEEFEQVNFVSSSWLYNKKNSCNKDMLVYLEYCFLLPEGKVLTSQQFSLISFSFIYDISSCSLQENDRNHDKTLKKKVIMLRYREEITYLIKLDNEGYLKQN